MSSFLSQCVECLSLVLSLPGAFLLVVGFQALKSDLKTVYRLIDRVLDYRIRLIRASASTKGIFTDAGASIPKRVSSSKHSEKRRKKCTMCLVKKRYRFC